MKDTKVVEKKDTTLTPELQKKLDELKNQGKVVQEATQTLNQPIAEMPLPERPEVEDGDPFWYMNTEDPQLENVTCARTNMKLGIEDIMFINGRTDAQTRSSIFGTVILRTVIGTINSITIFYSKQDERWSLRAANPSHKTVRDGKERYTIDVTLSNPVKAQILRYLNYRIKSNIAWADANGIKWRDEMNA